MTLSPADPTFSRRRRAIAWTVHAYTGLGLPLAFLASIALYQGSATWFFLACWGTCFIDATDGTMARRARVKEVLPEFDGGLLDNIIDYLTFTFLPALALPAFGMLPGHWMWVALLPILSSGYGFAQARAKTEESFVGFPSYWNIVVLYLYVLDATPLVTTIVLAVLALLVFVPIHYIYPTKTRFLRTFTVGLGALWALAASVLCAFPDAEWTETVAWITLAYPVYYFFASLAHHRRIHTGRIHHSGS